MKYKIVYEIVPGLVIQLLDEGKIVSKNNDEFYKVINNEICVLIDKHWVCSELPLGRFLQNKWYEVKEVI